MELQLVKKNIQWEWDYTFLEDDMISYCKLLLEEKNLPLVTFELWYNLSYSQWSWVWFKDFNISFDELIKYLLEVKTLTQIEYDILYSAHEEWLYNFNYGIWSRNKVEIATQIYHIRDCESTNKTYSLLKQYKNDQLSIDPVYWSEYFDWDVLENILSEHLIELALKDLMDSICYNLKYYWYDYIELRDEWNNKNDLVYEFFRLNNIETNIETFDMWDYIRTKKELLESNIPIETYTRINDNNLNDYYISNDIINSIEEKERVVKYYSLTI